MYSQQQGCWIWHETASNEGKQKHSKCQKGQLSTSQSKLLPSLPILICSMNLAPLGISQSKKCLLDPKYQVFAVTYQQSEIEASVFEDKAYKTGYLTRRGACGAHVSFQNRTFVPLQTSNLLDQGTITYFSQDISKAFHWQPF